MIIILNTDKKLPNELLTSLDYREFFLYPTLRYDSENKRHFLLSNYKDFALSVKDILKIVPWHEIDDVISCHENANLLSGFLRSLFNVHGHTFQTMLNFTNKYIMREVLKVNDIKVPEFKRYLANYADKDGFLIKPFFGACCDGIADAQQYSHDQDSGSFFYERFVDVAAEYHIDTVMTDGRICRSVISQYIHPVLQYRNGAVMGSRLLSESSSYYRALEKINYCALAALGGREGVFHLEAYIDKYDNILIGEVASRPAGAGITKYLAYAADIDLWEEHLLSCTGKETIREKKERADNSGWFYTCANFNVNYSFKQIAEIALRNHIKFIDKQDFPEIDSTPHPWCRLNNSHIIVQAENCHDLDSFFYDLSAYFLSIQREA